jgi:hypothetical protein
VEKLDKAARDVAEAEENVKLTEQSFNDISMVLKKELKRFDR